MLKLRPLPAKSIGQRLLEAGHAISVATPGDPTTITKIYPDGRREIGRWNNATDQFEPYQPSSSPSDQTARAKRRYLNAYRSRNLPDLRKRKLS